MLNNEQVLDKLQFILGTLKDGEKGYRESADEATSAEYKQMFNEYAAQRARLIGEIEQAISRLGDKPREHSSVGAALHRAWINVRDAITGKDDYAVIAEAERGEDAAIQNYQDVLKEELPSDIRALIEKQYTEVKAAHDRVRDLKHALQASRS
ncbi:PA2169 family four-helix-bundle protein [Deinococcus cellulosilyticus]|uniref:Chemotaxis protein n=1 Tax=Deinococcus cellulosilyticus (strain DSM 18568 / NBRC 106333 / KACC 11606 / 5516J-15) TaxID=1223518 RepID=A0A511N445_DEIC1|nr:PA2169 family four-helix-bundle protein [Deinococcus cellulosilyticus]GEM47151.1 chemotaxis protein [Deinococcus cellulosilyticus NBRC 106333 = KACC 11606]